MHPVSLAIEVPRSVVLKFSEDVGITVEQKTHRETLMDRLTTNMIENETVGHS